MNRTLPYSTDLPLKEDPSSRFVPWIIGLMIYLATIALMVALSVSHVRSKWDQGLQSKITIEIPSTPDFLEAENEPSPEHQRVLDILRRARGIRSFHIIPRSEIIAMMKPWLGSETTIQDLPFSTLIDVEISDRSLLDLGQLKNTLAEVSPKVRIEDHQVWQRSILDLAKTAEFISFLIVALICLAAISTIAFTSQTSLIIHRQIIEILHLIGATHRYIASQFEQHALRLGIRGGLFGFGLSLLTILLVQFFSQTMDTSILMERASLFEMIAIGFLVPIIITSLMMFSARLTVLVLLKKL